MSTFDPDELGAEVPPTERADIAGLARELQPSPPRRDFQGELREGLLRFGAPASRPERLWLQVAGYGLSGAALLALAAVVA